MSTYRTFIAIELPPDIRQRIKGHIDQLRAVFPDVRASWARENNLHLTLKFLGDVPVERIPALSNAGAEAAHEINPFDLVISGCGTFPLQGRPKVLWIGCAGMGAKASTLHQVYERIEDHCAAAGFEREARAHHPHLTIARLRESKDSRALAEHHKQIGFVAQTFTVSELVAFRSELSSRGPQYTALSRLGLG